MAGAVPPPTGPARGERLLGQLLDVSHRLHPDDLVPAFAETCGAIGVRDLAMYVADLDQRVLIALPQPGRTHPALDIDSTLAGRAFRTEQILEGDGPGKGERRLWVPMIDGAERIGVLLLTVAHVDDALLERARWIASLAAMLVVAKSAYGDGIRLTRRQRELDLAAELCWAVLPPLTFISERVAIAGILKPAYDVAGDCFDYAINGDTAHVAIFDAMGHGLEAGRIANLAMGTYRTARRKNFDLVATVRAIDVVVASVFGDERFTTGQLATLHLPTGALRWINAGHPKPLLLRGGKALDLRAETCLPFGLGDTQVEVAETSLEPGDSVLFFTDGVTEARSPEGVLFGRARLADLLVRTAASDETVPELMRRLSHAVLEHQHSTLQDDATLLILRWTGPTAGEWAPST